MSKCISSHGEYSEHEPGDPCPWCGEYDTERIIAERDEALARVKAVRDVLDVADSRVAYDTRYAVTSNRMDTIVNGADIRRALDGTVTPPSA